MRDDQRALLAKAADSIAAAQLLLERGFAAIAASRAYYAMFYLASTMLLEKNLRFKRHSAVQAAFGREITQRGILPVEFHGWLLDAFKARNASDYWLNEEISAKEAADQIERAERFLREVEVFFAAKRG